MLLFEFSDNAHKNIYSDTGMIKKRNYYLINIRLYPVNVKIRGNQNTHTAAPNSVKILKFR